MGEVEVVAGVERRRCRRAVVSIVGFWLLGALGSLAPWGFGFIPVLGGLACGLVFFHTQSELAAEGTVWRPLDFWNLPGYGKAPVAEKLRVTNALLRPSWWARVVNSTAWPRALVWSVLAVSLAVALLAVSRPLGSILGSG
jgi:hypothetical protein